MITDVSLGTYREFIHGDSAHQLCFAQILKVRVIRVTCGLV